MLNKLQILCVGLAAFLSAAQADAQFALSAGASFPLSAYTDNGRGNYYSQLRIGFDIGAQYNYSVTEHLDAIAGVNFIRHSLSKRARDYMGYSYSVYPSHLNLAMMLGAAWKIDFEGEGFLNPEHHAFVEARFGANCSMVTRAVSTDSDGAERTTRYGCAWRPCWSAGAGLKFTSHSSITLRYLDLGCGRVSVHEKGNGDASVSYSPQVFEVLYTYNF